MPLVTSKELLLHAQGEGYAVGAFNANNMELVKAVIQAAVEEKAPVILQISQGAIKYAGLEMATAMVRTAAELVDVPVVLHLDHGTDFLQNVKCLRAGFTSLMYDGSATPLAENIGVTRKITEIAHGVGIPVESELGKIPQITDYLSAKEIDELRFKKTPREAVAILREKAGAKVEALMADPKEAGRFARETGCDSLAAATGSIHGVWDDIWPLRIDRVKELRAATDLPLVSHGSSGVLRTPEEAKEKGIELREGEGTLQDAIKAGISKVNVATAVSLAFLKAVREQWEKTPTERDMRKILLPGQEAAKELVREYIRLLGSSGKASAFTRRGEGLAASEIKHHE
jgi:fructose-bisphosphate aldolase class II